MRKIFVLQSFLLFSIITIGQNSPNQRLDSLFTSEYNKKAFNGNVLIADKGNVLFEKSYGLADEDNKQQLNANTVFELASVSKQFTATGIVLLQKQGKLNYEDRISKYIPELEFYGAITIKNLLNHTGGLPDYMELFEDKWDKSKFATNQDVINAFAKHKPAAVFQPGEKFEYSNTGYALLGSIIEKVSKKSFAQYLAQHIFKPLKMENTFIYRSRYDPKKVDNYALGYVTDSLGNKVLLNSFGKEFYTYYLDGIVGDGMVNSTVIDLLKWDRALYDTKLLNAQDKELIFNSAKTKNGTDSNYGFGWIIVNDKKYGKIVNHSGGWAGYITFIERHLDNDKTIIMLQNNSTALTKIPVSEVRRILYNEKMLVEAGKKITVKPEDLNKYAGVYSNNEIPLKITIAPNGNILTAQATGQGAFPLDPYENNTFMFDPAKIKIVFNPDEKNMIFTQGNRDFKFTLE